MIDITDADALRAYLAANRLIKDGDEFSFSRLGGGVSCEVVKVVMPNTSIVIKQAKPKLRVKEDWYSDVSRAINEKDCLAFYNRLVPECSPKLLFYDDENYLFGMSCAPTGAKMWKQELLDGRFDFTISRKVAESLADVHNSAARDEEIKTRFMDRKFFIELRIDPYLKAIAKHHAVLNAVIEAEIERMLKTQITLVHGDYSPKNILVDGDKIYILDFEVAHYGDPAFDLAFLTNHFLLKAVKNRQWAAAYLNMMTDTAKTYLERINFADRHCMEKDTVRVLALLFLARVDGKSPVEYITDDSDKALIRKISYSIVKSNRSTFKQVEGLFRQVLMV